MKIIPIQKHITVLVFCFVLLFVFFMHCVKAVTPPQAPTGVYATPKHEQIILNWNASVAGDDPIVGYNVYQGLSRDTISTTTPLNFNLVTDTSFATYDQITNGIRYFYAIEAVDNQRIASNWSEIVAATPHDEPYYSFPSKTKIEQTNLLYNIRMHDNKIVWSDVVSGTGYIYIYDTDTGVTSQIIPGYADQYNHEIYENIVVFSHAQNGNYDVYVHDLSTDSTTQITSNFSQQLNPAVYKNIIVWEDNRNGNYDIYMHDLDTSSTTAITTNFFNQNYPDIYNNKIVWTDERNGNSDIYMYNIDTATTTQITSDTSVQRFSTIYKNIIVWEDNRNGNYDFYMHDTDTEIETQITFSSFDQLNSSVHNNKVVWVDARDNSNVYLYDIETKNEYKIPTNGDVQSFFDTYNDKIVWLEFDRVDNNYDIYTTTFNKVPNVPVEFNAIFRNRQIIMNWSASIANVYQIDGYNIYKALNYDDINFSSPINSSLINYDTLTYSLDNYTDETTYYFAIEAVDSQGLKSQALKTTFVTPGEETYYTLGSIVKIEEIDWTDDIKVYDNKMVWTDERSGNLDIYLYDFDLSTTTQITTSSHSQYQPAIYDNKIVWTDDRNSNTDIYMYNLDTLVQTQITNSASNEYHPSIYVNKIVFESDVDGNPNIFMYDIDTSTTTQITIDPNRQIYPLIYNNIISWQDDRGGNDDIYIHDLDTGSTTQITSNTQNQYLSSIYENFIIWLDLREYQGEIYMYNIDTASTERATFNRYSENNPNIYNNKIIWQDSGSSSSNVYLYDFNTKNEYLIASSSDSQYRPIVHSDKIIWIESGNINMRTFIASTSSSIDPPKQFRAIPGNEQIVLNWDASVAVGSMVAGYNIYASTSCDTISTTTPINSSLVSDTTYTINNLANGVVYYYAVEAVNDQGIKSKISAATYATPYDGAYYQLGDKIKISNSGVAYQYIGIYNDKIVWRDDQNGNGDIYMYNIDTATTTQITSNLADQQNPAIYDNKIVWQDKRNGDWDIYMYNIDSATIIPITTNTQEAYFPTIYENKIVWQEMLGQNNVYIYDLDTSIISKITDNIPGAYWASIHSDKVVWSDNRNDNHDVYMYDLNTDIETQITSNLDDQKWAAINNNRIAWYDFRNGNWDIYTHDLDTAVTKQISCDSLDEYWPSIHNNRIVWQDKRNSNYDIYLYDAATNNEYQITTSSNSQDAPEIYNDKIVWLESDGVTYDVYMRSLYTTPKPPIDLNADGANPSPIKTAANFNINWTNSYDPVGIKGYWYKLGDAPTSNEDGVYATGTSFLINATASNQMLYVWLENNDGNKNYNNYNSVKLRYQAKSSGGGGGGGGGGTLSSDQFITQSYKVSSDGTVVKSEIKDKRDADGNIEEKIAEAEIKLGDNIQDDQKISLDSSDISQVGNVELGLDKEVLQELASNNPGQSIGARITNKKPKQSQKDPRMLGDDFEVFSIDIIVNDKEIKEFSTPLNLSFDLSLIQEDKNSVKLYFFNEEVNAWKLAGNGGQLVGNKLVLEINHLSDFALLKFSSIQDEPVPVPIALNTREQQLVQIREEAYEVFKSGTNLDNFISYNKAVKNIASQTYGMEKYAWPLVGDDSGLTINQIYAINNFIVYSTPSTRYLGKGERAGVVSSYKKSFNKFPINSLDWRDVIAIANGRWPSKTSQAAIKKAKQDFARVYIRQANMENQNDNAAVIIMAYGLRSKDRNLNSEKVAIKSFKYVYWRNPKNARDWDIVRAIAYSGASRKETKKRACRINTMFKEDLKIGLYNEKVVELQKLLKCLGYHSKDFKLIPYFGNATKKAVQDFQVDNNIVKTGIVGGTTRAVLNEYK